MTVGEIFTKSGNFIENRQIFFMLLNCTVIAQILLILKIFKHAQGGHFLWTRCTTPMVTSNKVQ